MPDTRITDILDRATKPEDRISSILDRAGGGVVVPPEPKPFDDAAWMARQPLAKRKLIEARRAMIREQVDQDLSQSLTVKPSGPVQGIRPLEESELAEGERQARRVSGTSESPLGKVLDFVRLREPATRFAAGARTAGGSMGRGFARVGGFQESVDALENEIARDSKGALGISGAAGQLGVGIVPFIGPGVIGYPVVFLEAYGNALADMDDYEKANDVAIEGPKRQAVAVGAGVVNVILRKLGRGISTRASNKLLFEAGQSVIKGETAKAALQISKGLGLSAAENALVNAAAEVGHNTIVNLGYDEERSILENVPEAAAMGAGLGLALTGGMSLGGVRRGARLEGVKQKFVDAGLVKKSELETIGDDLRLLWDIAKGRKDGMQVEIRKNKDGQLEVATTPDNVSWEEKVALDHNDMFIERVRAARAAGKTIEITAPLERGVVSGEEHVLITNKLNELGARVKTEPKDYDPATGVPLTKRAVLEGDIKFLKEKLAADPQDRMSVNQARLLVSTARRNGLAESLDPARPQPDLLGPRERVVTPLEITARDRLRFTPESAKSKGYLRNPADVTPNLKLREKVRKLQEKFFEEYFPLRRGTSFNPTESFVTAQLVEDEFVSSMDRVLKGKDDNWRGARRQVVRSLNKAEVEKGKIKVVSDHMAEMAKKYPNLSQRETIARVLDDFEGEPLAEPIQNLYTLINSKTKELSLTQKARRGLVRAQKALDAKITISDQSKAFVGKLIANLPPEEATALGRQLIAAKTTPELRDVLGKVKTAQETLIRNTHTQKILENEGKIEKSTRRGEATQLLDNALPRATTLGDGSGGEVMLKTWTGEDQFSGVTTRGEGSGPDSKMGWNRLLSDLYAPLAEETPGLSRAESDRLKLARDSESWGWISETHKKLSTRFDRLVKTGALTKQEAVILRYILEDFTPDVLNKSLRRVRSRKVPDTKRSGGLYDWSQRTMTLARRNKGSAVRRDTSAARVFIHELMHGAYFSFLEPRHVLAANKIHYWLTKLPSGKGYKHRAYDIIEAAAFHKDPNELFYWAEDPAEFFAEMGAMYLIEKIAPPPVLRAAFDKIIDWVDEHLVRLSRNRRATKMVPKGMREIFDMIHAGEGGGPFTFREILNFDRKQRGLESYGLRSDPGKEVDPKSLEERLATLPLDKLQELSNSLASVIRKGQIEKGLYDRFLKFQSSKDAEQGLKILQRKKPQGGLRQKLEDVVHVGKMALDPVMIDSWLEQADPSGFLSKVMHKDLEKPYSRAMSHQASARKFVAKSAQRHLGIDNTTARGELKLVNYLRKELPNGIQRGEAMWAYALSTDEGRSADLDKVNVEARNKLYEAKESIKYLTDGDKAFVDEVKTFLQNNPFIEKAFATFELLNGRSLERFSKYFSSRRESEKQHLPKDLGEFQLSILKSVDALHDRENGGNRPFLVDGGFVAEFYNVVDKLATYGEMGKQLHRAERLMTNPEFAREFKSRYGEQRYNSLALYLNNIQGTIGVGDSAVDRTVREVTRGYNISKLATNVFSGLKQTLSLLTTLGDDVIDSSALLEALAKGSAGSTRVGKEMRENSGFTDMRLSPGRFAESLFVLGHKTPSARLKLLQEQGLFVQKFFDDRTLRVIYRAAEIMAKRRGLTGQAAKEFTVETFEKALQRNQTSSSPLYVSELELQAVKRPQLLGVLSFMRELNRVYNVSRRHVVNARRNPTQENIGKAIRSIMFAGVGNTAANVAINNVRRVAFGLPAYTAAQWATESLKGLAGQFYLLGDTSEAIATLAQDENINPDRFLGPLGTTTLNAVQAGQAAYRAVKAGNLEPEDADLGQGPSRGLAKQSQQIERLIDKGLASMSGVLGLPLWMMYYQGKGLYNWTRDDYRLMLQLEQEQRRLEKDPEENSLRLKEIENLKEQVNKVHRQREKGYLTKKEAQQEIGDLLKDDAGG